MPPHEQTSSETTWSNFGAQSSHASKLWNRLTTRPHTQLDLETCADDGALYQPALTTVPDDFYERFVTGWREPRPRHVEDGTAICKLLLDTALTGYNILTRVQVLRDLRQDTVRVSTKFITSRGDLIEVLSPLKCYPSKMLIETIQLLY